MKISFRQKGDFSKTFRFMDKAKNTSGLIDLHRYGKEGVAALSSATPIETGKTAQSWNYNVTKTKGTISIGFYNSNIQNGAPIAILIQYGHGLENGGWVQGRDYINPAIQPIFDKIVKDLWKEVTKL